MSHIHGANAAQRLGRVHARANILGKIPLHLGYYCIEVFDVARMRVPGMVKNDHNSFFERFGQ